VPGGVAGLVPPGRRDACIGALCCLRVHPFTPDDFPPDRGKSWNSTRGTTIGTRASEVRVLLALGFLSCGGAGLLLLTTPVPMDKPVVHAARLP